VFWREESQKWLNANRIVSHVVVHAIHQNQEDDKRPKMPDGLNTSGCFFNIKDMYYKRRINILYRNYGDFGYLTDNRNFGYRYTNVPAIGDRVLSQSAAIIIDCMGNVAMSAKEVANYAIKRFDDVEYSVLVNDIEELLDTLVADGFFVKGFSKEDCTKTAAISFDKYHMAASTEEHNIKKVPDVSSQEFLQNYFGDNPFPISVHIEIVGACNEKCVHCYLPQEAKKGFISLDLFRNIIIQVKELNILHLTLSGGEPMLHPNFIEILSLCNAYDMSINILSNVTNLTKDMVVEMKKNPVLGVQISLYSMEAGVHDSITGVKGSWSKTMKSIKLLIANKIPIQISCPIMKQNLSSFNDVKKWGESNSISVSADYVIIGGSDGSSTNLQNRLQITDVCNLIKEEFEDPISKEIFKSEVANNKYRTKDDYICSVCNSSLCIGINGDVFPCAGWQSCVLGNIKESTLKKIWFDSDKAKWLRNLKRKDLKDCDNCKSINYCTICLVRNANESNTHNPLEVNNYFCKVAELKKQIADKEFL
jgi:radical SAM additional 4Fe4S-binding domain